MNFIIDFLGIFFSFGIASVYQEKIVKPTDKPPFVNYLFVTFSSNGLSWIVGYFLLQHQSIQINTSREFLFRVFKISSIYFTGQQIAYYSLKYVSFPLLMLIKSSKLVPVFLISFFYNNNRRQKKLPLLLITSGIIFFTVFKTETKTQKIFFNNEFVGIVLLLLSIFCDGLAKVMKENLFQNIPLKSEELMFYNAAFLTLLSFVFMFPPFSSQLFLTINYYTKYPESFKFLCIFSLFYSSGQIFVFRFIKQYGIVYLIMTNMIRKILSVVLSLILFHRGLNWKQILGVLIVFCGVVFEFVKY